MKTLFTLVMFCFLVMACKLERGASGEQAKQTEELAAESNRQVGMPGIANFTEKRLLRELYELRDGEISTYTYIVDWQGRLFHVCDSVGFGVPFSAQFSSPEFLERHRSYGPIILPQPEPNGLFPPTSSSATWVICADSDGQFKPVYVEPSIMVSTFPLAGVERSYSRGYEGEAN